MVEIKTNFTVEEIAKSNFEAKNKFKIINNMYYYWCY